MNEHDIDELAQAVARELQEQRRSLSEIPASDRQGAGDHEPEPDFDA